VADDLFGPRPRRAPRKLMHVCDAYEREGKQIVELQCARCGHQTGWVEFNTVTEARAGLPCPECNADGKRLPLQ
jgi:DNA-directed RNA polymerase subunit RPC12/RpoP